METVLIFIGVIIVVLAVVFLFVFCTFWLIASGIDSRYRDIDSRFREYSPDEIAFIRNNLIERRKQKRKKHAKGKDNVQDNDSI